jgi:hypothetical protein
VQTGHRFKEKAWQRCSQDLIPPEPVPSPVEPNRDAEYLVGISADRIWKVALPQASCPSVYAAASVAIAASVWGWLHAMSRLVARLIAA